MYYVGKMSIDPSQLTEIEAVKPTRAFKKMLYVLTAGAVHEKVERETFCAVSILQQLNAAFRAAGIAHIIRLAKDGVDFFREEDGQSGALQQAFEDFRLEVDQLEAAVFETLFLILEHEDEVFKYLIEVQVNRSHAVGEYPIQIEVNGLFKAFKAQGDEYPNAPMDRVFEDQAAYDRFREETQAQFDHFMSGLRQALKTRIHVDDIEMTSHAAIIRPSKRISKPTDLPVQNRPTRSNNSPVFHEYCGMGGFFAYTFLWSALLFDNGIEVNQFQMVGEDGNPIMDVGEQGIDASMGNTLDPDMPLEAPDGGDFSLLDGGSHLDTKEDSSSWFAASGFDFGGDGGDGGGASCSSCGGCGGA